MPEMTPRQRWLAALTLEPVDRLPFWPKLDGSFPPAQAAPFSDMDCDALHDWIGSDKHVGISACYKDVRRNTSLESKAKDGVNRMQFQTPAGTLERVDRFDPGSQSWHPVEFPVKTHDDIKVMTEWCADCDVEFSEEGLEQAAAQVKQVGETAVTTTAIGVSPLMDWVQHFAGIENAHLFLTDCPGEVEALFDAIDRVLVRRAEITADKWPGDAVYSIENTSTTLVSPEQYERYWYAHIRECGEIFRASSTLYILHMCGHLKALLPRLATLPADAFEAFTSPTLGNTTLLDGRTACPGKCLIGGTNATLWTRPADEIIATVERDLDALPHHRGIVVTSAGVMPPLCKPETIKAVCEWVRAYPARM